MTRDAGAVLLALALGGAGLAPATGGPGLAAQVRRPPPVVDTLRQRPDTTRRDTTRADSTLDTTRAGRQLPRRPSRTFPEADSITAQLMRRPGYRATRYRADSVRLLADEKEIQWAGEVLIEREGASLEADTARYVEDRCALLAVGSPRLYDPSGVLFGGEMTYDACNRAGVVRRARTDFQEGSATWFLYGDIVVDNEEGRQYAVARSLTSCDLEDEHYHFAARQVKYISRRLMVSRPAVLYVQDVPVMWLPFIFQDMKRGRRSGLIPPQFGLNDIVRNSTNYQRHVANFGYYFAISDYADAQVTMDWYAQRFVALNGRLRYRWLNRFLAGGIAVQELREEGGSTSRRLSWSHQQQFNLRTQLTANLDYASSSRVVSRNSVDPILATAQIDSRLNFQRRFDWGQLNVGGSRSQSLDKPQVSTTFPSLALTPREIAIARGVSWSPALTLTNSMQSSVGPGLPVFRAPGVVDSQLVDNRATSVALQTPLRIGRWTWSNSLSITDAWSNRREWIVFVDPVDSSRTIRTYAESYETGFDWQTGFGLPILLQGSWNLSPSVQLVNTTGGPYLLRNRFSDGRFVSQGKRLQFAAGVAPTFFGLFGGIGPFARIRHSVAPGISWSYAPAADVPEEYARAANRGSLPATLRSDPRQTISIGLNQTFEAKLHPDERQRADTVRGGEPPEGRKLRLLSVQSDALTFDLEQGKKPGRTAWTTDVWGNTISSDLLRGFSVRVAHDLFYGPVGVVGSRLRPSLTSVALGFSIGSGTVRALGGLLGLRTPAPAPATGAGARDSVAPPDPTQAGRDYTSAFQRGALATRYSAVDRLGEPGSGFTASLNYSLQRTRPDPDSAGRPLAAPAEQQTISGSMSFSPTRHWRVSWQTSYNVTRSEFSDHVVRLDRDLHDWRATFTFVKSPNGNFLFNFGIELIDQREIHFDYDQRNVFR